MTDRISAFKYLQLPDAFGVILLVLALTLALAPYFSGADFGVLKIPSFTEAAKKWLKVIGPLLFVVSILIFLPIFPTRKSEMVSGTKVSPTPIATSTNVAPTQDTAPQEANVSSAAIKESAGTKKDENTVRKGSGQLPSPPAGFELTRLEAEDIIQRNRGDIERCLSNLRPGYYYLDFVFSYRQDGGLNIDIYRGREAMDGGEFLHPQLAESYRNKEGKLSVNAPDVNKCIIQSIKGDFRVFTLDENRPFIHRYITEKGGG